MPGADDIDSNQRLEAVEAIVTDCESTATEITNQFSTFETDLVDIEERSIELKTNIGQTASYIVAHAERNQEEITSAITELTGDVTALMGSVEHLLSTIDERNDSLFESMINMDAQHTDVQGHIDSNATQLQEVLLSFSTSWDEMTDKLKTIADERSEKIDTDIRSTLLATKLKDQVDASDLLNMEKFPEIKNTAETKMESHILDIRLHLADTIEDEIGEQNVDDKTLQERSSSKFEDRRTEFNNHLMNDLEDLSRDVTRSMSTIEETFTTAAGNAELVINSMGETNTGLNQLVQEIEKVCDMFADLSLDS